MVLSFCVLNPPSIFCFFGLQHLIINCWFSGLHFTFSFSHSFPGFRYFLIKPCCSWFINSLLCRGCHTVQSISNGGAITWALTSSPDSDKDDCKADWKVTISKVAKFLRSDVVLLAGGLDTLRFNNISLWSDGSPSLTHRFLMMSSLVIIRSSMWHFSCVDSCTCCARPKDEIRYNNFITSGRFDSHWKLKSPPINKWPPRLISPSKISLNSIRKSSTVHLFFDEYGGQKWWIWIDKNNIEHLTARRNWCIKILKWFKIFRWFNFHRQISPYQQSYTGPLRNFLGWWWNLKPDKLTKKITNNWILIISCPGFCDQINVNGIFNDTCWESTNFPI